MDTARLKILILEDRETDAEMIQHLLRKSGLNCQFQVMMTREDYVISLDEFKPDIILSDNAMPQFSASEALEIMQQRSLHIPFILVTGTVSEEFAAGIIKAGADDYLLKDRLARLPVAIETALKQKQTEREKLEATEKLVQSEKRFRALVENNDGIIALVDRDLNSVFRSSSAAKITGWSNEEFEKVDSRQYIHPDDMEDAQNVMVQALANPATPIPFSIRAKHKNGNYISLEGVVTNLIDDPAVGGIISNLRDVTERVIAEQKIIKANRLYFFISQINQMIVRTTNEATLFEEVCRIAVELGQFPMAWIGLIDETVHKVIPVMMAGEEKEWLSKIAPISIDGSPDGCGPAGASLQKGKYIICNNIEKDPGMVPWKVHSSGKPYSSCMVLPVKKFGKLIGAFSVYASEHDFFDDTEIALLEEAVNDLSFALENFDKEALRKNAEEAVIKSEQRYHTLAEVSPVGIFHTDADGYTTYVNPRWTQISGLPFEEAMGNGWLKAVHPEDKEALIKGWQEATNIQDISNSEYRFLREDGTIAWVIGHAIPEKNSDNQIVGYVGTITDITERKKAEDDIVKEKELSDKIINSLPGIFYLSDPTPKLVRWNTELERISGYSKEELEKIAPIKLFDPGDHAILRKGIEKSYREGKADVEVRLVTRSGQIIPFYFTGAGIEYVGKPAVLGTGIDISERKKAEEAIKKSNERFELIAEATNDGLWDWNLETNQLWGNEVHQQLYGLTLADPVPNHDEWKSRIHPEDRERTLKALEDAKATGQKSYVDEYRFYTENKGWMNIYGRTLIEYNAAGVPVRLIGSMMDITERKKTEELLAANEKRFRKLIENGNDAFAIVTPGGKALYVSSSVERVLGYTEEEIYRMDMLSLLHPDHREEAQKTMEVVMANPGIPVACHLSRLKHKDGTWHWFEETITNLMDDPDIGGIVDNFRDVTERVKDQMALEINEEKYRDIVENITDILCTHDLEGKILSVNLTAKKQLGYEIEEMLKMNIKDILLPQTKENFNNYIGSLIKRGYAKGLMYVRTRSGENRIWEFRNTLRNNGIDPPFVYGFAQDVTERIQKEEEIKTSEEKRRLIMNSALDAIICINTKGLITFWNPQAERIFGWKEGEVMGRRLSEIIIPQAFRKMHDRGIDTYLKTGEAPVLNVLLELNAVNRKNEEFPIELTVLPIKQGDEEFFCAFIRDITQSKKAAEEIKFSEEKYRSLVEQASDGIFISDKDGRFITVNQSACKISQYTEAELLQMTIFDFFVGEDIQKKPIQFQALAQGKTVTTERIMKRKDGGVNYLEITSKLLKDGKLLSFVRDVAERRKAEEALKASEEKYRTLVEQASDAIFIADTSGRFVTVNSSACKLAQRTEEELMQMNIYDFAILEDLQREPFHFDELKEGKTVVTERIMKVKEGLVVNIEVTAKLLSDGRLLAFVRDISQRIKVQTEIIKEKNLSDSIINSLPGIFYLYNKQGKFLRWNTNFEKVTLYSSEEIREMHPIELFTDEEKELLTEKISNVFINGEDEVQANLLLKSKETIPYFFTGIAIDYEGETCLMGVGIDFSEREKAQQEIEKTTEKLRELTAHLLSVREEERKRIGREIHDELGQQLTAIKMDVSWIDKKLAEDSSLVKNKLKNIITLLDGSNQSIRRILSELRPGILDDYGLIEALEWQNRQFTSNTGIPVKFTTTEKELKLPEPVATCIFRVYQEAFTNITRYADAKKVTASLTINNGIIKVTVADDGKGFDTIAVQSKKSFGILGMRERVLSLNGKFALISSHQKGTKITISIPL
jgi:PAS domain S-box-containing protein